MKCNMFINNCTHYELTYTLCAHNKTEQKSILKIVYCDTLFYSWGNQIYSFHFRKMVHWLWTFTLFFKSIYQNTGFGGTDSKMQNLVVTFNGLFWSGSLVRSDILFLMALGPACLDGAWVYAFQCTCGSTPQGNYYIL